MVMILLLPLLSLPLLILCFFEVRVVLVLCMLASSSLHISRLTIEVVGCAYCVVVMSVIDCGVDGVGCVGT